MCIKLCTIIGLITFQHTFAGISHNNNNLQQTVITGRVTDSIDGALAGVKIFEKGTVNSTASDLKGNYSISVSSSNAILVFSLEGYDTEEIQVNGQPAINMVLTKTPEKQDDLVEVGYGSIERSRVTGAISSVSSEEISRVPLPNVIEALRGQIPGVRISRSSGTPGSDVDISIRGLRSIDVQDNNVVLYPGDPPYIGFNAPLIVVDGVPYSGGKISDINPDDIDRIDILKDAAAASVYGSGAANGVILITTKRGFKGKPSINIKFSRGITQLAHKPEVFNGEEYTRMKIDGLQGNISNTKSLTPESVLNPVELANYNAGRSIDWQDVLLGTGRVYQGNLSVTGGTSKFHYYANAGLYTETGIVQHTSYKKYSFRLNADYTPFKFLTFGANMQLTPVKNDETGIILGNDNKPDFTGFIENSPLGEIHDSTGTLAPYIEGFNPGYTPYNPLYEYAHSQAKRNDFRTSVAPFLEFRILNGLSYRIKGFAEIRNEGYHRRLDGQYDPFYLGLKTNEDMNHRNYNYLFDNILDYHRTFHSKNTINFTAVYGLQRNSEKDSIITAQSNYIYGQNSVYNYFRNKHTLNLSKLYFVTRLNYSFDSRYNLTFSRRWDYSYQIVPSRKTGKFYAVAAAWNISNEKFLQNNNYINDLKYRISWGKAGNDHSNDYSLQSETSKQFNTGVDFSIFKNRISGSFDYYNARNSDIFYDGRQVIVGTYTPPTQPPKPYSGISTVGMIRSWGIDALFNVRITGGDFTWQVNANWSKDVNRIVNLGENWVDANGNPISDITDGRFIGQDINEIYGYKFTGIVQYADTAQARRIHPDYKYYTAGDPKIADIDGNDTINVNDKTFLGSSVTPNWYGGLTNTFSYKRFELSVLIETVQGIKRVNNFIGTYDGRTNTVKENYWTPTNQDGNFPQPNSAGSYYYPDAVRIQDASFVAIRNVSLSYNLPPDLLKRIWIKSVIIYIRGNNLKYFTKFQAYSPESVYGAYPVSKVWTAGLNVMF